MNSPDKERPDKMIPKKRDLNNMQKGKRKIKKTLSPPPYRTMDDGSLLFTNEQGVDFTGVLSGSWSGKTTSGGSPLVYRSQDPEIMARQNSYRSMARLLDYVKRMEEWDKAGRQGERPFRFEYMMRPRRPETPELDKTLRPMTAVKRKEGRKPELIMRSNDQMQTGQEPNYYKVWDEGRKQWSTRPVEPEELDRYRRENRIYVTPSISF